MNKKLQVIEKPENATVLTGVMKEDGNINLLCGKCDSFVAQGLQDYVKFKNIVFLCSCGAYNIEK